MSLKHVRFEQLNAMPQPDRDVALQHARAKGKWGIYVDPKYISKAPPFTGFPLNQWPWKCKEIRKLRQLGERGVGDTVARIIDAGGGRAFAATMPIVANLTGKYLIQFLVGRDLKNWDQWYMEIANSKCKCEDRQRALNVMFPYRSDDADES